MRGCSTKSISLKSWFSSYFQLYGGIITYCRCKVHSHLNSKMEILAIFSILNSLFLPKMEILTLFSILTSLFLPKMEILTVFSILLNKKSGKLWADSTKSIFRHSFFPDFWLYNKFGAWKKFQPRISYFLYIQLFGKLNSFIYLLSCINIS